MENHERIALVGFSGAGKKTVTRALAAKLGWRALMMYDEVVRREKCSIERIANDRGIEHLNQVENLVLFDFLQESHVVISTADDAASNEVNLDMLLRGSIIVWLKVKLEVAVRRCEGDTLVDALMRDKVRREARFEVQVPYFRRAHLRVETSDKNPDEVVEAILRALPFSVQI